MSGFLPSGGLPPPASITDSSISPSATLIDATVALPTSIVFKPSITSSSQGVYKTWAEVMIAVAEVQSPLTIFIDFSGAGGIRNITLPTGIYDIKRGTITAINIGDFFPPLQTLTIPEGCTLKNVSKFSGPFMALFDGITTRGLIFDAPIDLSDSTTLTLDLAFMGCNNNSGMSPIYIDNSKILGLIITGLGGILAVNPGTKLIRAETYATLNVFIENCAPNISISDWQILIEDDGSAAVGIWDSGRSRITGVINFPDALSIPTWNITNGISCTSANRPSVQVGASVFDTTLQKPIWYTGFSWVKADGTLA